MTTDVFTATLGRATDIGRTGGATNATVYSNLTAFTTTRVTNVQSKVATGSTANPAATFTSTPTQGNAMIAVLCRTADNAASTNAGWTLLTSSGVAASRRIEIWWRRAGASEPTTQTWTNATAAAWELTLIECGGWAAVADPVTITAGTTVAATTTTGATMNTIQAAVSGIVLSNTISSMAFAAGTSGQLKTATLVSSSTRTGVGFAGAWLNRTNAVPTFSWTTSRAGSYAQVGWPQGTDGSGLTQFAGNIANAGVSSYQVVWNFATATIPDANTVTAATLTATAYSGNSSATGMAFYDVTGSQIAVDNSDNWAWRTPTAFGSLTKVASYAAGGAWTLNSLYDMTSTGSFLTAVNKTATTSLLWATDDQVAGTTRATNDSWGLSALTLTVVHNLQATSTVTATTSMTPTVARAFNPSRTIAATIGASPIVARTVTFIRSVIATVNTIPIVNRISAFARTIATSITANPVLARTFSVARTIATSVSTIPDLASRTIRYIPQAPRIIQIGGRSTIQLVQTVTARIGGRFTIRAPKE